uniref:Uncharacterized protein n=1 Tax=Cucumis melo TaxID=3656 RepID=A0A9I9CWR8_CUCME
MKAPTAGKAAVASEDRLGAGAGPSLVAMVALTAAAATRTAQVTFFMSMVVNKNEKEETRLGKATIFLNAIIIELH